MTGIIRSVLGVFVGAVAAGIVIGAVEGVGHLIYPLPPGVDMADAESLRAAMADVPAGALLIRLLGWGLGSLAGGWVAALVAGRSPMTHAFVVGLILTAAGISNLMVMPHPAWFLFLGLLIFMPAALVGAGLAPVNRPLEE